MNEIILELENDMCVFHFRLMTDLRDKNGIFVLPSKNITIVSSEEIESFSYLLTKDFAINNALHKHGYIK